MSSWQPCLTCAKYSCGANLANYTAKPLRAKPLRQSLDFRKAWHRCVLFGLEPVDVRDTHTDVAEFLRRDPGHRSSATSPLPYTAIIKSQRSAYPLKTSCCARSSTFLSRGLPLKGTTNALIDPSFGVIDVSFPCQCWALRAVLDVRQLVELFVSAVRICQHHIDNPMPCLHGTRHGRHGAGIFVHGLHADIVELDGFCCSFRTTINEEGGWMINGTVTVLKKEANLAHVSTRLQRSCQRQRTAATRRSCSRHPQVKGPLGRSKGCARKALYPRRPGPSW